MTSKARRKSVRVSTRTVPRVSRVPLEKVSVREAREVERTSSTRATRSSLRSKRTLVRTKVGLSVKASRAVKAAADSLWNAGETPHQLLKELHEVLLLRCLAEAEGNYASAAKLFGPSRQSVQQFANSPLRDDRWVPYQQNRRRRAG